jgi:hypothetical protein
MFRSFHMIYSSITKNSLQQALEDGDSFVQETNCQLLRKKQAAVSREVISLRMPHCTNTRKPMAAHAQNIIVNNTIKELHNEKLHVNESWQQLCEQEAAA